MDLKDLYFVGTCLDGLRSMPEQVRKQAGFELHNIQIGKVPDDWKPV